MKREVADVLVLGNVITMDEHKPYAEAVAVKEDKILYVGTAEVAKKLCDDNTKVYDYGKNSVYPGFLEAHCHPGGAGFKIGMIANLRPDDSLEQCVQVMKEYMEKHPEQEVIQGQGFEEHNVKPHFSMLDAICPDKIMICTDSGGHSMWLNSRAMEAYGIDQQAVERWGTDCVRVDENGMPTGYISENPVFYVRSKQSTTLDQMKTAISNWQDYALSMGYTGSYNAGVELISENEPKAYYALEEEGKLKHYTYAGSLIMDNTDTPEEDMDRIAAEAEAHNSKHYKLLGAKVFCDGVVEAHTAWMVDDYFDKPGYKGVSRFDDHDKMVRLLKAAEMHHMNVHIHTIGDAASKAWVDAIAEAEEATGDFDMRNALAHLQVVKPEDIRRFADYNIMAVCGILWVEKTYTMYEAMAKYVGRDKADEGFPVKAFLDEGAVVVSHSDYPVSPSFSVPWTICLGTNRYLPSNGKDMQRNPDQCISRLDSLKAVTTNVAYMWHEEDRMGSLEIGKLANMAIFDKDFMRDDFDEIENAKCLATFVDGELVYSA
ncbi:MAG: amidohydrolase [Lachnospiraceae bacterium]|nr:amidohydrolase [Lachnospiraceae bacterium]